MTPEQHTLADIHAHLETLPLDVRVKVNRMRDALHFVINIEPQAGILALALLGAEKAAE